MFSKNKKSSKKFKKEDDIQNNRIEMNIQNAVESENCDEKVLKEEDYQKSQMSKKYSAKDQKESSEIKNISDSFPNSEETAQTRSYKITEFQKRLIQNLQNETSVTIQYRKNPEEKYENDLRLNKNLEFFRNMCPAIPNEEKLTEILETWKDDFKLLELNHDYIQWLFPIHTPGMNVYAHPLQLHEYNELKSDKKTKGLLLKSFGMMLNFYGSEIKKDADCKIIRSTHYKQRYINLKNKRHNFLRISRILQCLGDFEMEEFQLDWLRFLMNEIFIEKKLYELAESFTLYWIHTIKSDEKRKQFIDKLINIISSDSSSDL